MNRDYDFTGIEQAARYSKLEHMRPGGISEWSKEAKYMVLLFETNSTAQHDADTIIIMTARNKGAAESEVFTTVSPLLLSVSA